MLLILCRGVGEKGCEKVGDDSLVWGGEGDMKELVMIHQIQGNSLIVVSAG